VQRAFWGVRLQSTSGRRTLWARAGALHSRPSVRIFFSMEGSFLLGAAAQKTRRAGSVRGKTRRQQLISWRQLAGSGGVGALGETSLAGRGEAHRGGGFQSAALFSSARQRRGRAAGSARGLHCPEKGSGTPQSRKAAVSKD
jgi:hypothetical protein